MNPSRREVLSALTVCGACAALGVCPSDVFADPPVKGFVELGPVADFAQPGIYDKFIKSHKLLLINNDNTLIAASSLCTHKFAMLAKKEDHLRCAKHGSEFDKDGYVLKGPAKSSLPRCAIKIENGKVMVDTSKIFEERKWDDPAASAKIEKAK